MLNEFRPPTVIMAISVEARKKQSIKRVMGISAKHKMNHFVDLLIAYLLFIYRLNFIQMCPYAIYHVTYCNKKKLGTLAANVPLLITFSDWLINSKCRILIENTTAGVALYLHYTSRINAYLYSFTCAQWGCLLNFKYSCKHLPINIT